MSAVLAALAKAARDPLWVRRAAATAVAGALLVAAGIRALNGRISEQELTAASIGIALVFGMITAMQNALGDRRRTTVELLGSFSTSDALAASDAAIARHLAGGHAIDADVDREFDACLIHVLDYYEYLCRAARSGAIDRRMLKDLRGPSVTLLFERSRDYIESRRRTFGDRLYCMTEWFVTDYCGEEHLRLGTAAVRRVVVEPSAAP